MAKRSNDDANHEIKGGGKNKTVVTNITEKEVKTAEEVRIILKK